MAQLLHFPNLTCHLLCCRQNGFTAKLKETSRQGKSFREKVFYPEKLLQ
jgi:hypothetical protein